MRIIVQKFGGSSVADTPGRECVHARIRGAMDAGYRPIVVISAMGRRPSPYATDTLLDLVKGWESCSDARERELLMACGENISAVVMAHYLRSVGIPARAFTGRDAGILTDDHYSNALISRVDPRGLLDCLGVGFLPVVTGFQGVSKDGEITTLGRGGSDTTAVAIGAALKAEKVEIYTDVDGIMAVDPRVHPGARIIRELTYEEVAAMSNEGAKVLHNRCVDLAQEYGIPLVVRNTFSDAPGSLVSSQTPKDAFEKSRVVTSIAVIRNVTLVSLDLSGVEASATRLSIFEEMSKEGISLDLINIHGPSLFFIVDDGQCSRARALLERMDVPFTCTGQCAKVSCVGIGMKGTPGVMAKVQRALCEARVEVLHSTDSHITICCLVRDCEVEAAVQSLHHTFIESCKEDSQ